MILTFDLNVHHSSNKRKQVYLETVYSDQISIESKYAISVMTMVCSLHVVSDSISSCDTNGNVLLPEIFFRQYQLHPVDILIVAY